MDFTTRLNFPEYEFSVRTMEGRQEIFDPARKRYVKLNPEEWVRQHVLQYLIREKHIPVSLIAVEYGLAYHRMKKRCDLLVFDKSGRAVMMVECKAPEVTLGQATLEQITRYNVQFKVSYLLITNGLSHYCIRVDTVSGNFTILPEIPDWESGLY